jgi:hypothetical protein
MLRRLFVVGAVLLLPALSFADGILWYNGDLDGREAYFNERDTQAGDAGVYDDFIVPAGGWLIQGVFSNNLARVTPVAADWEIRQGVSAGNGGSVVASGTTSSAFTWTPTGRTAFGDPEYTVHVTGLNVALLAGTYWLMVRPADSGVTWSYAVTTTSGAHCVGPPCGNDLNSFFDMARYNDNFFLTPDDFSMGVDGVPIPEPASLLLLGSGLVGIAVRLRRRTA